MCHILELELCKTFNFARVMLGFSPANWLVSVGDVGALGGEPELDVVAC
jgi:hypothetical protein